MTPLTVVIRRAYKPTDTLIELELCAEGKRLDDECKRLVVMMECDPYDLDGRKKLTAALQAYFQHKRNCIHCKIGMYPRLAPAPAE